MIRLTLIFLCVLTLTLTGAAFAEIPKRTPSKESPYKRYEHVQKDPTGLETLKVEFEDDRGVKRSQNVDYIEPTSTYQQKMLDDLQAALDAMTQRLADVEGRVARLEDEAGRPG